MNAINIDTTSSLNKLNVIKELFWGLKKRTHNFEISKRSDLVAFKQNGTDSDLDMLMNSVSDITDSKWKKSTLIDGFVLHYNNCTIGAVTTDSDIRLLLV